MIIHTIFNNNLRYIGIRIAIDTCAIAGTFAIDFDICYFNILKDITY